MGLSEVQSSQMREGKGEHRKTVGWRVNVIRETNTEEKTEDGAEHR